jgi:hypothetical protein
LTIATARIWHGVGSEDWSAAGFEKLSGDVGRTNLRFKIPAQGWSTTVTRASIQSSSALMEEGNKYLRQLRGLLIKGLSETNQDRSFMLPSSWAGVNQVVDPA